MDVPSKEKRGIAAESHSPNESFPAWLEEEFDKAYLHTVNETLNVPTWGLTI
jgi:hypothetical protein